MSRKKLTPLMTQYWEIKSAHQDKILLFRMGDFFEMFHDDAVTAAPILDIALTKRNKKAEDETPMCGFPHHSIAGPINKLLSEGFRVAICDQVEDPKEAKGIVKRAVTRVLSPGMVYDPDTLDDQSPNYICAFDDKTVSFLDSTTGEAFFYQSSSESQRKRLFQVLNPKEYVLAEDQSVSGFSTKFEAKEVIESSWPESANRLACYAKEMQGEDVLSLLSAFEERELDSRMQLSANVLRHLEVFENSRGERKGSLFQAIARTKSAAGTRLFKQWIRFPLAKKSLIEKRLEEVSYWQSQMTDLHDVRDLLSQLGDIERRLGKISNPQCQPRDLLALSESLRVGLEVNAFLKHWNLEKKSKESLNLCSHLSTKIVKVVNEEAPANTKNGGFINKGVRNDLDELIDLSSNSQKALSELELREKERTQIPSLKIRYNNVFGYYIEVTNTHKDKVPENYLRKQTLTNAERYVTEELSQLEAKVLSARTRRIEMEFEVFAELKKEVLAASSHLLGLAKIWSEVDVFTSLAWLAIEENYCRPEFTEDYSLSLKESRHAVVEQEVAWFVPNDLELSAQGCLLLTGPNMAGKSTFMRQVAIVSILAQIGSFVPAKMAKLPLFERIFTRIGASDFLAEGLSTFMVEMTETAEMLNSADDKCLVVLDEIGRGTSTYDGMSLAQSILEFLVSKTKCITLFATHYHELTALEKTMSQVINAHMAIKEREGQIDFLHRLASGPANRSYGIHVAELAGLPAEVTQRADEILGKLESSKSEVKPSTEQMSLFDEAKKSIPPPESSIPPELLKEIKGLTVHEVTPLEALNKIAQWQQSLS